MRAAVFLLALLLALLRAPAERAPLNGDALLARAAKLHPLPGSYAVPIAFAGRLRHPLPIGFHARAMLYFKAPDRQALVLVGVPHVIGHLFHRSYGDLDTIVQRWPIEYHVTSVTQTVVAGEAVYQLEATPKTPSDIAHVTFNLLQRDLTPVGAAWFYNDGEQIDLTVSNESVGRYTLPREENIAVTMHAFSVAADGTTGTYALNTPVPDALFADQ